VPSLKRYGTRKSRAKNRGLHAHVAGKRMRGGMAPRRLENRDDVWRHWAARRAPIIESSSRRDRSTRKRQA
jgi:hypothetical protein